MTIDCSSLLERFPYPFPITPWWCIVTQHTSCRLWYNILYVHTVMSKAVRWNNVNSGRRLYWAAFRNRFHQSNYFVARCQDGTCESNKHHSNLYISVILFLKYMELIVVVNGEGIRKLLRWRLISAGSVEYGFLNSSCSYRCSEPLTKDWLYTLCAMCKDTGVVATEL